jgi:hypothetical protein
MKLSGVFSVMAFIFLVPQAVLAQGVLNQGEPRTGTWKLNLAKSKFNPGPPPKSQVRRYNAQGKSMKLSVEGIGADESPVSYGVTLKYDGRDYPIIGSGTPSGADTVAQKHIDPYTVEATFKKAGNVIQTVRSVVSREGKILTITTTGANANGQATNDVAVFDRQ